MLQFLNYWVWFDGIPLPEPTPAPESTPADAQFALSNYWEGSGPHHGDADVTLAGGKFIGPCEGSGYHEDIGVDLAGKIIIGPWEGSGYHGDIGVDLAAGTILGPGPLWLRPKPCDMELVGADKYWEGGKPCCQPDGDDFPDVDFNAATQLAMACPITGAGPWPTASSPNTDVGDGGGSDGGNVGGSDGGGSDGGDGIPETIYRGIEWFFC